MSFFVREKLYRQGAFDVVNLRTGEPAPISTVDAADDNSLLVTLLDDQPGDSLRIRPTSLLRDYYNTPANTTVSADVAMPIDVTGERRFIATRASRAGERTIAIDFNAPVDPATAVVVENYTLSPAGRIVSAGVASDDPRRVLLVVADDYPLGPLGLSYTVTIMNVRSDDGRLVNDGAGSVVGFTLNAADLSGVYAYPQPFSIARDQAVTFAKLVANAQVEIYSQTGRFINRVKATEGNGGATWNGADELGRSVASGIYLYRISVTAEDGSESESELRKLAVVP
jgi:hypothetical protein